jgi:hypothetical protein
MIKLWIAVIGSSLFLVWGASYVLADCADQTYCKSCGFRGAAYATCDTCNSCREREALAKRRPPEEPKSSGISQQKTVKPQAIYQGGGPNAIPAK